MRITVVRIHIRVVKSRFFETVRLALQIEVVRLCKTKGFLLKEMSANGDLVLPGDIINNLNSSKKFIIIGPGLRRGEEPNSAVVTKAGKFYHTPPNTYWVETIHKRYVPKKGDMVVGIVTKKGGDNLKVDIGSAEPATLSLLAFAGATKKQRPDLQIGDAVYAKLLSAHREMEPELVCIDQHSKAGNMGPLSSDGYIVTLPQSSVYRLLDVENPLLRTLGKKFPFEIVLGMNGRVWLNTKTVDDTFTLVTALYAADHQSDSDIIRLCRQFQ